MRLDYHRDPVFLGGQAAAADGWAAETGKRPFVPAVWGGRLQSSLRRLRRELRDARPGLGVSLSLIDQAAATKTETTERLQGYSRQ